MIELSLNVPLSEFDLRVDTTLSGSVTAVVGPSGAGKTSLLETIAGLRPLATGRIAVGGRTVMDSARGVDVPPERRRFGYVPQDVALFPHLDVRRNILFGAKKGAEPAELIAILGLEPLLHRYPSRLSGGEKQRVALARALMTAPDLLLLDEPLAALDPSLKERVVRHLRKIREHVRIPMIYVTHQIVEALALSDETIVLSRGEVVAAGKSSEVLRRASVAGSEALENVFEVDDPVSEPEGGTVRVRTREGVSLVLPSDLVSAAEFPIAVRISGEEVLLFAEEPRAVSARNVLSGIILGIESSDGIADVTIDAVSLLRVRITASAAADLRLEEGKRVWVALRSRSFRIVG
ncbi:MAG: molybdenum ABC transporter ATP-binding protein [Thermoanaerobaculia bacterium]